MKTLTSQRVVITGMGALTPLGNNVPTYWQNLLAGKSGAAPITYFDTTGYKTTFACQLKDFDINQHFDRKQQRKLDPYTMYGLIAATQAMQNSGIDLEQVDRNHFGVIWATGNGGIKTLETEISDVALAGGVPRFTPFFVPRILHDTCAGQIAMRFGLKGKNYATVSACASATTAAMDGFNYIRWGKAKLMMVGGSEAPVSFGAVGGFSSMRALSTRNDSPETASRPFDATRDGFVIGEGAGALIFEEYEHAKARGAAIYAEVMGAEMTADAYHPTAAHPEGEGVIRCMHGALEDADLTPAHIQYLNAHATSTPLGDMPELKAIGQVFSGNPDLLVSGTKSMTGHLLGAAGAIEMIACALATKDDAIPPTINTQTLDPEVPQGLKLVLGQQVKQQVNYAMCNNFGFGGHNATIIMGKPHLQD